MVDTIAGEPIGDLIRQGRHLRGLTQQGLAGVLAHASGNDAVTRRQVARWEQGKRIPSKYWRNWIGVTLEVPSVSLDRAAALTQFLRAVPEVAESLRNPDQSEAAKPRDPRAFT